MVKFAKPKNLGKKKKEKKKLFRGGSSPNGNQKGDWGWLSAAMAYVLAVLAFIYLITGGVSQRRIIETIHDMATNISNTLSNWVLNSGDIDVSEDGVYWRPSNTK